MTANKARIVLAVMTVGMFGAVAAANVSESFESDTVGETAANWSGYCYVTNQSGAYAKTDIPGYPISGDHAQMLAVEGSAVRQYSEDGDRVIDMMVMAEELPDEELPAASGDEQIKLAFDTNGCINIYCTPAGASAAAWKKISNTVYPSGTWVRVTCTLKYPDSDGKALCQVKVDGSAVNSEFGYRAADNLVTPGAWYKTAIDCSTLAKLDFAGCGAVDDVVNALTTSENPYEPAVPADAPTTTNGVEYAWYDQYGLPWSDGSATAPGGSGYTLQQAYQTGVDPYGDKKLYVTNSSYSSGNLVLTFNGYGRTYKVETKNSPFTDGTAGTEAEGTFTSNKTDNVTTWTGTFPTAAITYYRVRATTANSAETINQFAVMKIASTAANTLVALPWKTLTPSASNPDNMTAAKVVLPETLTAGDYLLYYNGGYKGWVLADGKWTAIASSTEIGTITASEPEATELARGQAIWVVRSDTSKPIYLCGQYKAVDESTTVVTGGSLLANPDAGADFTVSSSKITNATANDRIVVPGANDNGLPKVFEYKNDSWGTDVTNSVAGPSGNMTTHTWTTSGDVMNIPAGKGFIYQPKGEETLPTINW